MPRNRITRPQNIGATDSRRMRNNSRVQQNRGTFQGGLTRNQGAAPQGPGQPPSQGMKQCPPGQQPGRPDAMGNPTCEPAPPNISGNVPVVNSQRAIAPGPKGNVPPRPKRGY